MNSQANDVVNYSALPFGRKELDKAAIKHRHDVCERTNEIYSAELTNAYGWGSFLNHINKRYGTSYQISPPPAKQDFIELMILYFEIKAEFGNANSVGFVATQNGLKLAPKIVDVSHFALLKYYTRYRLANPDFENPMLDIQFTSFYNGLIDEAKAKHKKEGKGLIKKPLYYSDVGRIIELTYTGNFIRKFNTSMGFYIRVWVTLSFAMFMRGDEIISLQFKHLKLGFDNDGDISLLFTFEAHKGSMMTFFIPENKDEPHIDCFTYINEYFKHLESLNIKLNDNDYVFPTEPPIALAIRKLEALSFYEIY